MIRRTVESGIKGACKLTFSQYKIMLFIARNESTRMAEVASSLEMKQNTVSVAIKELENDGLVIKRVDDSDGRATNLVLSDRGLESLNKTSSSLMDDLRLYWSPLTHEQRSIVSRLDNAETSGQPDIEYINSIYRLSKTIDVSLSKEQLTFTQVLILLELNNVSGMIRPIKLIKTLDIHSNTLTAALKILARKDYIEKSDVIDEPGTRLSITKQGRNKVEDAVPKLLDAIWEVLAERYSKDEIMTFVEINISMVAPYNSWLNASGSASGATASRSV